LSLCSTFEQILHLIGCTQPSKLTCNLTQGSLIATQETWNFCFDLQTCVLLAYGGGDKLRLQTMIGSFGESM
jgi:hypothetical protein